MQYARKITFEREIVLVAVYPIRREALARRFAIGQTVIGTVFSPCSDGHDRTTVSITCDAVDNNDPENCNTFNGDFVLANVPASALRIEELPDEPSDHLTPDLDCFNKRYQG